MVIERENSALLFSLIIIKYCCYCYYIIVGNKRNLKMYEWIEMAKCLYLYYEWNWNIQNNVIHISVFVNVDVDVVYLYYEMMM